MLFRIIFPVLCLIILVFIVIKLYKINEKFISDFDEVLDYKCLTDTNRQMDNYVFGRGICDKNTCPTERCDRFYFDSRTSEHNFISEVSPKSASIDSDGNFTCSTKENLPNHIYCETMAPFCPDLGSENFCFEHNGMNWEKHNYKKVFNENAECKWYNKTTGNQLNDESYLEECLKEPIDCSLCNIPCATLKPGITNLFDNYQRYVLQNADGVLSCVPDGDGCGDTCSNLTKIAYKLISNERRYEPILYRQQLINGGSACVYLDGNGYCHPVHKSDSKYGVCTFEPNVFENSRDCTSDNYCTQNVDGSYNCFKFCCNLNDRDVFETTKYAPFLSRDGTRCVYKAIDRMVSRELEMEDDFGFNCPGYEFRLCQNPDEFRNVEEQKCTPCPSGKFLRDNTQFLEHTACVDLPDCTSRVDDCYEDYNETGTIKKLNYYTQEPRVQRDLNGLNNATCESTAPAQCYSCPSDKILVVADGAAGIPNKYCDLCPVGQEINPVTLECDTKINCPSEITECYDPHHNRIFDYQLTQDDAFSPCVYKKVGSEWDTMEPSACSGNCPPEYVRDEQGNCIIPTCVFSRTFNINPSNELNTLTNEQKNDVFNQIDIGDNKHRANLCHINTIQRVNTVSSSHLTGTVCRVTPDTTILPELSRVSIGELYNTNTSLRDGTQTKQGAKGACPQDCEYSSFEYRNQNERECTDRDTNKKTFGNEPGEKTTGTTVKTSQLINESEYSGKSCDIAKRELLDSVVDKNYQIDDRGSTIKLSYSCILPHRKVDCEYREICTNCQDTNPCEFKQTCHVVIDKNSFGGGTECPSTAPQERSCPNTCKNCEELGFSEWTIDDHDWQNDLVQSDNEDIEYTRDLVVQQNCMYNGVAKRPGDILYSEDKTVPRTPLSAEEIASVCVNDDNYNWTPSEQSVCTCFTRDTQFRQTGTLKQTGIPTEVRGLPVNCMPSKTRDTNCSAHYNSGPCSLERDNLDTTYQTKLNELRRAIDTANTTLINANTLINSAPSSSIPNAILNAVEMNRVSLSNIKNDSSRFVNNQAQHSDKTQAIATMITMIVDINQLVRITTNSMNELTHAIEFYRQSFCSNADNWDFTFGNCPTTDCYPGGTIPAGPNPTLKENPNRLSCTGIEILNPPTETCDSTNCDTNLTPGVYFIKQKDTRKYLQANGNRVELTPEFSQENIEFWFKILVESNENFIIHYDNETEKMLAYERNQWTLVTKTSTSPIRLIPFSSTNGNTFYNIYSNNNIAFTDGTNMVEFDLIYKRDICTLDEFIYENCHIYYPRDSGNLIEDRDVLFYQIALSDRRIDFFRNNIKPQYRPYVCGDDRACCYAEHLCYDINHKLKEILPKAAGTYRILSLRLNAFLYNGTIFHVEVVGITSETELFVFLKVIDDKNNSNNNSKFMSKHDGNIIYVDTYDPIKSKFRVTKNKQKIADNMNIYSYNESDEQYSEILAEEYNFIPYDVEEQNRLAHCSNLANWNIEYTCPATSCYEGGKIHYSGYSQKYPSTYTCDDGYLDTIQIPQSNCDPVQCLNDGFYKLESNGVYLNDDDIFKLVNNEANNTITLQNLKDGKYVGTLYLDHPIDSMILVFNRNNSKEFRINSSENDKTYNLFVNRASKDYKVVITLPDKFNINFESIDTAQICSNDRYNMYDACSISCGENNTSVSLKSSYDDKITCPAKNCVTFACNNINSVQTATRYNDLMIRKITLNNNITSLNNLYLRISVKENDQIMELDKYTLMHYNWLQNKSNDFETNATELNLYNDIALFKGEFDYSDTVIGVADTIISNKQYYNYIRIQVNDIDILSEYKVSLKIVNKNGSNIALITQESYIIPIPRIEEIYIKSGTNTSMCLSVDGGDSLVGSGDELQMRSCADTSDNLKKWKIRSINYADASVSFNSKANGLVCIDYSGDKLKVHNCNDTNTNQIFKLKKTPTKNRFKLQSSSTNKYLKIKTNNRLEGTSDETAATTFTLERA